MNGRRPAAPLITMMFAVSTVNCATAPPPKKAKIERTTKCWAGQLTKIDKSGYHMASVPMLLRVERDPSRSRMVRELALGNPAHVTRDVLHVTAEGELSFVESDLDLSQYQANGDTKGEPWTSDVVNLELIVPGQSVRIREWTEKSGEILYGHYRYRDADGEYTDERFHALSAVESRACNERLELARSGAVDPAPGVPAHATQTVATPAAATLNYDWPANMDATIRARIRRTGTASAAPNAVDATYQLRTVPVQEGLQVITRSRELLAMPSHTLDDADRWERATALASLFPAVLIDDTGNVSDLAEAGDYLFIVRNAFLERWGGGKDTKDEDVLAYVDQNLSAELAKVSAQRYWNPLVAFWAGANMRVGESQQVELTRALYVPGALKPIVVQVPTTYALDGWVPCTSGETEARCVKLTSSYSVGEWDIRNELADAGEDGKPIRVMRHVDETTTVLIADPATLLPYHYYEFRKLDSLMGNALEQIEVRRTEEMDLSFSY